ncbi:MAG: glucuronate isomerase [Eubacterium sp.]
MSNETDSRSFTSYNEHEYFRRIMATLSALGLKRYVCI